MPQGGDGGHRVTREVVEGAGRPVSGRSTYSALVVPEHRDVVAGELVAIRNEVPVVAALGWPRAADHHDSGLQITLRVPSLSRQARIPGADDDLLARPISIARHQGRLTIIRCRARPALGVLAAPLISPSVTWRRVASS